MSYSRCPTRALVTLAQPPDVACVVPAVAGAVVLGPPCWVAQAAWLPVGAACVRTAMETTVPVQDGRLGSVRLSVNNVAVTRASPTTPASVGHIRRRRGNRRGRTVTRSVTGIASLPTSLVKVANSGPRPG
jgi:hypothetical protein